MSGEKLTTPTTTDNSLSATIKWYKDSKFCLKFNGRWFKKKRATYTPPNRIDFFVIFKLDSWIRDLDTDFTLEGCLFHCQVQFYCFVAG